jgi:hypothetical protein
VGLISIVNAFSFRRDETLPIAINIAKPPELLKMPQD